MLDSSSVDKAFDLAFSLASASVEAALRGMQLLSSLTGGKLDVIVAGLAGLLTFLLTVIVFTDRRPRNEVSKAWPSASRLNKVPESPSYVTMVVRRIFEAPQHVEKERLELTDELREQLHRKFWEASSEPSHRDVAQCNHQPPGHPSRALYPAMKLVLVSSTTQVTALIDGTVSHVRAWLSSSSTARTTSQCSCSHDWQRVGREGWTDDVASWAGWYPWQCQQCLRCSYFRRRQQT